MANVELQRTLSVPVVPARSALSSIMHDIHEERGEWAEFALYINLGALGLPDVGYVAIPVKISDLEERTEPEYEIRFVLRARRSAEAFPTLKGAVGIDATGPSNAVLWLAGTYEVPLKQFGMLFDQMFGGKTAEKSLKNMIEELADAVIARVEKRELASVRYRMIFNSGD